MRTLNQAILIMASVFLLAFTSYEQIRAMATPEVLIEPMPVVKIKVEPIKAELLEVKNDHNAFLEAIGHKESRNRYDIVNKYGYLGRYQFGKRTLKGLGFKVSKDEFLNNPLLQEEAMQALLEENRRILNYEINTYCGQTWNGIVITESGLLAAAHLGGPGSVKKFFKKGKIKKDAFGTSITSYMKAFGGYELNLKYGNN